MDAKSLTRKKYLSIRTSLNAELCKKKSAKITQNLANYINLHFVSSAKQLTISLYESIKNEPDVLALQNILTNFNFCLPQVLNNTDMQFVDGNGTIVIPDICIVPAVAFTINGDRIGYGKGYYDRFLAKHAQTKTIIKIGCCFKECIILPQDATQIRFNDHDVVMDGIIFDN